MEWSCEAAAAEAAAASGDSSSTDSRNFQFRPFSLFFRILGLKFEIHKLNNRKKEARNLIPAVILYECM
jgi:hypothetical protein